MEKIKLNLYRIIFKPANGAGWATATRGSLGFAFILAVGPETAKQQWIENSVETYMKKYPSNQRIEIIRSRWSERWEVTELIEGPFENGFIICNTANNE